MSFPGLPDVAFITRDEWGARPFPRARTPVKHTHLEVHHDVYPAVWPALRHAVAIQDLHLAKGWNGPFYSLGLDRGGQLWELRGIGWQSVAQPGYTRALTVVAFGDYHDDVRLTAPQLHTLGRLMALFPNAALDWHAQRGAGTRWASACPGRLAIPTLMHLTREQPLVPVAPPDSKDWLDMATREEVKAAVTEALNELTISHAGGHGKHWPLPLAIQWAVRHARDAHLKVDALPRRILHEERFQGDRSLAQHVVFIRATVHAVKLALDKLK